MIANGYFLDKYSDKPLLAFFPTHGGTETPTYREYMRMHLKIWICKLVFVVAVVVIVIAVVVVVVIIALVTVVVVTILFWYLFHLCPMHFLS